MAEQHPRNLQHKTSETIFDTLDRYSVGLLHHLVCQLTSLHATKTKGLSLSLSLPLMKQRQHRTCLHRGRFLSPSRTTTWLHLTTWRNHRHMHTTANPINLLPFFFFCCLYTRKYNFIFLMLFYIKYMFKNPSSTDFIFLESYQSFVTIGNRIHYKMAKPLLNINSN